MSYLTIRRSATDILKDFERGAIDAIQKMFPELNIKGCFFHLFSTMWKHVQNIGLKIRYVEEPEFVIQLRMLTVLAFLRPQDILRGFGAACNKISKNVGDVVGELLVYFEDIYIGRFYLTTPIGNPMFSKAFLELRNMFYQIDAELVIMSF